MEIPVGGRNKTGNPPCSHSLKMNQWRVDYETKTNRQCNARSAEVFK